MDTNDNRTSGDTGYDPRTGTFHAHFEWDESQSLKSTLVEALSVVENESPSDLPALHNYVDVDALAALFEPSSDHPRDNGSIEFDFDGRKVTITASGEIIINDDPKEQRETANNVLLLAPEFTTADDEACIELLQTTEPDPEDILSITFTQSAQNRLEIWHEHVGSLPENAAIVNVGATTRAVDEQTVTPTGGLTIHTIGDPSDLDQLGITITDQLSAWKNDDNQTAVCFHSLHALLNHVDLELAFRFLHILTRHMRKQDIFAHYHMDPSDVDEETIKSLDSLFDIVTDRTPGPSSTR